MIGCSPFSGGAKQFIMSGTRMDLTIPTVRSVRAMVDQLPNRGREAEMLQELHNLQDTRNPLAADWRQDFLLEYSLLASQMYAIWGKPERAAKFDFERQPSFLPAAL